MVVGVVTGDVRHNMISSVFIVAVSVLVLHSRLRHTVIIIQGGSNMTGTINVQFTHKSVPVIFESPCIYMIGIYL
jgi:hypothetical protein